jgi:hypothetical protein
MTNPARPDAAIAMDPQHDRLLRNLICRAAGLDEIPRGLCVVDGGWEFRGLLARVAAESSEADWTPEIAEIIGDARVGLVRRNSTLPDWLEVLPSLAGLSDLRRSF